MPIINKMDVTVEADAFENDCHMGKHARVVKVVGAFAIIDIEGVGIRSCLIENVQPRMTGHNLALAMENLMGFTEAAMVATA